VQALIVVVPETASELGTEFSLNQEPAAMHQIILERVKKRLHVSIVPGVALPVML
jgi:hypothetical protein